MKNNFLRIFVVILATMFSFSGYSQLTWTYTNTGTNHTIMIPANSVTIGTNAIAIGDYIGVFYNTSGGGQACGGYIQWTGMQNALSAWGTEAGMNNGFATGEVFQWKVWQSSTNTEFDAVATYNIGMPPFVNDSTFSVNGISGIIQINAIVGPVPETIDITAPATASNWQIFDTEDIVWTSTFADNLNIDLIKGGSAYTSLATNVSNTNGGTFSWNLTGIGDGNDFQIVVYKTSDPSIVDTSDMFSITAPQGYTFGGGGSGSSFSWTYTNTGTNHTILIQPTATITIDGQPIQSGDYVGVFFDSLGSLGCGGYQIYTGLSTAVTAWGADAGNDGFGTGEVFKWRIYQASTGNVWNAVATYQLMPPMINNDSLFVTNGLSQVATLTTTTQVGGPVAGPDMALHSLISPMSACELTSAEMIKVGIQNVGNAAATAFDVTYSLNGGTTVTETYTSVLPVGAYDIVTFANTEDLSTVGDYIFDLGITFSTDVDLTNNSVTDTVSMWGQPVVNLGGNQTFCGGSAMLDAGNTGANFSWAPGGETTQTISPITSGWYYVTVEMNGCVAVDSANITISINPTVDLGSDTSECEGNIITLDAANTGMTYLWNTGATTQTIDVNSTGTYDVIVTDASGCMGYDTIIVTINPLPTVSFSGLSADYCEGAANDALTGNPTGGSFSGTGVFIGSFFPVMAGVGQHDITYTYTDLNGCTNFETQITNVHANPTPDLGADVAICQGETTTLDASATYSSFNWSNGATTQTIDVAAGNYTVTVSDMYGCEGTDDITVTENPVYAFTEDYSICDGEMYNWHGTDYSNAGTYTATYQTMYGCDSNYTLNLTVNPVYSFVEDMAICDGNTYNWHGMDYTVAGTFYDSSLSMYGCDSVYTLNLTVHPNQSNILNESICDNETYMFAGQNLNLAGTYYDTLQTMYGCDSVVTLNLTVNPTFSFIEDMSICDGDIYTWHGTDYTAGGTYYANYQTMYGCDSIYTLNLTVNPEYSYVEDMSICDGELYNWHGTDYTLSGTYYDSSLSMYGCDSVYTLNLTVNPTFVNTQDISICNGDVFQFGSQSLTTAGTYFDTLQSIYGCDSVVTLNLTVNNVYSFTEDYSICDGDNYNWHGTDYTVAGTYTANYQTMYGCDSVYTLNLTVNPVYSFVEDMAICDGDVYNWHGTDYTVSGTYYSNYQTINACDSNYTLNLTVHPNQSTVLDESICDNETYAFDGMNLNTSGTYYDTLLTMYGCDSVVTLNLTVNSTYAYVEDMAICDGDSYTWHGTSYTTAGTYFANYQTMYGCDSNYTLNLTVNPVYSYIEDMSICDGDVYNWHGTDYTVSGTYFSNYQTINGCDSNYTLNLTVHPNQSTVLNEEICDNEVFMFDGQNLNIAGTYFDTLQTMYGCDSVVTLNLVVNPTYDYVENYAICNGDSYTWHGTTYTAAGTYFANYQSMYGCDSNYTLNLTVNPTYSFVEDMSICDGDVYTWHGTSYNLAGTYFANYQTIDGCDSIYTLNLTVNPVYSFVENMSICDGETYNWHGTAYTSAGTYTANYQTMYGCDSIYTLNLVVNPLPTTPVVSANGPVSFCEGDSVTLQAPAGFDYLWNGGQTTQTLIVHVSGSYNVIVSDQITGCASLPSQDVMVTVNPNPVVDLGADQDVCIGDIVTLDAGTYSTYMWNTAETTQTIDVDTSGTYSVVVNDMNGCTGMDEVVVTFHESPVVDLGMDTTFCEGEILTLDAENAGSTYLWSTTETTQTIDVTTSGTYSVVVTNQFGCEGLDTIVVDIYAAPVVDLGPDQTATVGDIITLDAGSFDAYLWNTTETSQTIDVTETGEYSVIVTDMNGCNGMDTVMVTFEMGYAYAPITFIVEDNSGEFTGINLLGSWDPTTGIYNSLLNEQGMFYDDGTHGDSIADDNIWTVTFDLVVDSGLNDWEWGITYPNGTWIDGNWPFTIEDDSPQTLRTIIAGIDDEIFANISIYPNPNNGIFTIDFADAVSYDMDIKILNTQGQIVFSENSNSGTSKKEFDLSDLAKGVYFVKIISGKEFSIRKLIIE